MKGLYDILWERNMSYDELLGLLRDLSGVVYLDYNRVERDLDKLLDDCEYQQFIKAQIEKNNKQKQEVKDMSTRKPIETITLQKFDEHFEDFYDSEKGVFVIYAGDRGFDGNIYPDVKVKDDDGVVWDCYLWKVEYIPSMDTYEIQYKPYEE